MNGEYIYNIHEIHNFFLAIAIINSQQYGQSERLKEEKKIQPPEKGNKEREREGQKYKLMEGGVDIARKKHTNKHK